MLHPSYTELIDVANKHVQEGEEPVVTSRYSIILAAAKRARQLVDGADTTVEGGSDKKPLSVAVEELAEDKIHIMSYGTDEEDYIEEEISMFVDDEELEEQEEITE